MMRFKARFHKLDLNLSKARPNVRQALEVQVRQAARAFLRAVINEVPVYTGMSRGSLKPLGRFLRVAIPIRPHRRARYYDTAKTAARGTTKNVAEGERRGKFRFRRSGFQVGFTFSSRVLHYLTNEFFSGLPDQRNLTNPVPWHSLRAGRAAYIKYLRDNLKKRIPKVSDFLIRTQSKAII